MRAYLSKKQILMYNLTNCNLIICSITDRCPERRGGQNREVKMADNTNEKILAGDTKVAEPVIDKHYQLIETKRMIVIKKRDFLELMQRFCDFFGYRTVLTGTDNQ